VRKSLVPTCLIAVVTTLILGGHASAAPAEVDDVILGVGGKPFESDARKACGNVITEAEKPQNKGVLKLIRWRKGTRSDVAVRLIERPAG